MFANDTKFQKIKLQNFSLERYKKRLNLVHLEKVGFESKTRVDSRQLRVLPVRRDALKVERRERPHEELPAPHLGKVS